ncbi:MAG: HIT domain-containing protein [Patescibacteria group bacterium]
MSIFTKIIHREIPADIIFENPRIIVIKDIQPQAKTHLLIIPKKEIPTINDLESQDAELLAEMFFVAKKIAKDLEISEGYKLHFNV